MEWRPYPPVPSGVFDSSILAVIFVPRVVLCVLEFCFSLFVLGAGRHELQAKGVGALQGALGHGLAFGAGAASQQRSSAPLPGAVVSRLGVHSRSQGT